MALASLQVEEFPEENFILKSPYPLFQKKGRGRPGSSAGGHALEDYWGFVVHIEELLEQCVQWQCPVGEKRGG